MKRTVVALMSTAAIALGISSVGFCAETEAYWFPSYEQTASALLDQGANEVRVTVDLTDGWSVEFAPGAVYLYDGTVDENAEATAIGLTLDQEVFEEYAALAPEKDSYREFARSFTYTEEDGINYYFFSIGPDSYFMISVSPDADGDAVSSRISVEPSDYTEDTVGE